jgi:choline dehydrogenase-like flavoprotein
MIVPSCHVTRLSTANTIDGKRVTEIQTERGPIPVTPDCKVIVALGTIESTRLALLSFGKDGRIGSNLMAHLRSNIDFRIPRTALDTLSPAVRALQSSALLVKGKHDFKREDGKPDGTVGYFHLQITASGLDNINSDSEAELFQKVPDIDTVNQHLLASDSHIVITIRGIGEMEAGNPKSNVSLDLDPSQTDYGERKAYVNLHPSAKDLELWDTVDRASDELAAALANGHNIDVIARNPTRIVAEGVPATVLTTALRYAIRNEANPNGRRDGLGTTHHEAGTLKMGEDPKTSVTDSYGRFHGIENAYVVGPALFPTIGSPNPMLMGLALARRLGDHLLPPPPHPTRLDLAR